eukprot:scaffold825_cov249-Pinguiococcus_pyrenoidosus.AAC.3
MLVTSRLGGPSTRVCSVFTGSAGLEVASLGGGGGFAASSSALPCATCATCATLGAAGASGGGGTSLAAGGSGAVGRGTALSFALGASSSTGGVGASKRSSSLDQSVSATLRVWKATAELRTPLATVFITPALLRYHAKPCTMAAQHALQNSDCWSARRRRARHLRMAARRPGPQAPQ